MTEAATIGRKLAPRGALRAAINLSNTLLVTGKDAAGDPTGLAPEVARLLAIRLGAPLTLVPFATPGAITDAAALDVWDVALIGAEHARQGVIAFSPPYATIEAAYLVRPESRLASVSDVDATGVRIAAPARTAYGLWLERNLAHATLALADGVAAARELFANREVDALAGLRPWLMDDSARFPGALALPESFTKVEQAIGFRAADPEVAAYLRAFVDEAKASGSLAKLMGVSGVAVAP